MKCSKCGFENDDNSKFCNQCGAVLNEEVSIETKTSNRDEIIAQNKAHNKGCLIKLLIAFLVVILLITCTVFIGKSRSNNSNDTSVSDSSNIPGEVEVITYSEILLENYLVEPEFMFSEYYNVVEPNDGTLRGKVEGTVKDSSGRKHEYTMIIKFSDDYITYSIAYLQLDGITLVDD